MKEVKRVFREFIEVGKRKEYIDIEVNMALFHAGVDSLYYAEFPGAVVAKARSEYGTYEVTLEVCGETRILDYRGIDMNVDHPEVFTNSLPSGVKEALASGDMCHDDLEERFEIEIANNNWFDIGCYVKCNDDKYHMEPTEMDVVDTLPDSVECLAKLMIEKYKQYMAWPYRRV